MRNAERIGFKEAFSIGVGGMIGGGIFAVLGLSIQLSKSAAPLAFLLAGVIALLTAYSYARLSVRYPSEGGTIEFLVRAFGNGWLSGGLNILLLASYIVMISLYAYAFGSYGANALNLPNPSIGKHLLITFVITLFTAVNALGAVISGETEDALVAFKLTILLIVVGASMSFVQTEKLSPSEWADPISLIAGGMIIFLAYEGFELIANTGSDIRNPSILPRVFYSSVITVIFVYVMVAIVAVGTLPYDVILKSRDYALAVAAEPALGKAGFWLITFAALASTSSAINATLYGTARASYMVAKYGELPESIEKPVWKKAYEGLLVTSIFSLILANTASLESISTAGSGGFLMIFLFVNLAAIRLRNELKISISIPVLGVVLTSGALLVLIYSMSHTSIYNLGVFGGLIVSSFAGEGIYRKVTGREIKGVLDSKLRKREEYIRNWHRWIDTVVRHITDMIEDAEVYLVGSVAKGDILKANDVDILVFTSNPPPRKELNIVKESLMKKAGLSPFHPIDIHFECRKAKNEALSKAKHYKPLRL